MKFEKINENKIKIILNIADLTEQNVDFHSFMSNPLQSQELFKNLLDNAEKEIGFISKNYNLRIEIISLDNIDFVIILTRLIYDINTIKSDYKSKTCTQKKEIEGKSNFVDIYCFESFDDIFDFCNSILNCNLQKNFTKKTILYFYNNKYYLLINTSDIVNSKNDKMFSIISDFATYIPNSEIFSKRLSEFGKVIIAKNCINVIIQYFAKKGV